RVLRMWCVIWKRDRSQVCATECRNAVRPGETGLRHPTVLTPNDVLLRRVRRSWNPLDAKVPIALFIQVYKPEARCRSKLRLPIPGHVRVPRVRRAIGDRFDAKVGAYLRGARVHPSIAIRRLDAHARIAGRVQVHELIPGSRPYSSLACPHDVGKSA